MSHDIYIYMCVYSINFYWIPCCILCYSSRHLDWFSHFSVLYHFGQTVSLCFLWVWSAKSRQVQVKQVKQVQRATAWKRRTFALKTLERQIAPANITWNLFLRFVSQFLLNYLFPFWHRWTHLYLFDCKSPCRYVFATESDIRVKQKLKTEKKFKSIEI